MFSPYGKILEIKAKKNIRLRGQAFIIFDDIDVASQALNLLQSYFIFGKPMKIDFAKQESDIITKRDGTYKPRKKKVDIRLEPKIKKKIKVATEKETKELLVPSKILILKNIPKTISKQQLDD